MVPAPLGAGCRLRDSGVRSVAWCWTTGRRCSLRCFYLWRIPGVHFAMARCRCQSPSALLVAACLTAPCDLRANAAIARYLPCHPWFKISL
jgi:hypothetical protein